LTDFADLYDGERALRRRVGLRIEGADLVIERPEGSEMRWPLADLRRLPDTAPGGATVVAPAGSPARLVVRGAVADRLSGLVTDRTAPGAPTPLRRAALAIAGAGAFLAILFLLVLPFLAGGLARLMGPEAEIALGDLHYEQTRLLFGGGRPLSECRDPAGLAALDAMSTRVTRGLDLPYELSVSVLDDSADPILNAYAVAGGRVAFFGSMIQEAEHPDEIAAVLAHEIGHVVNHDPVRGQLQQLSGLAVLSLLLGDVSGGGLLSGTAAGALSAGYSRSAEAAADRFATERLRAVGLPPSALGTMFERLRARYGETEGLVAHFASHPQLAARIAATVAIGDPEDGPPALTPEEWADLRGICD
jgi:Zn-dependent protease with chaperone function